MTRSGNSPRRTRCDRSPIGRTASAAATLIGLVVAVASGADAATIGPVTSAQLGAWQIPGGTGVPTVYAWDNFTGPPGTNLNGQPSGGGGPPWAALSGTWTLTAGNKARLSAGASSQARLVVNCGYSASRVYVTVGSTTTNFAGLVLNGTGGPPAEFFYVAYRTTAPRLQLGKFQGGAGPTVLASVNIPFLTTVNLVALSQGGVINIWVNGTLYITYTMTPAEAALFTNPSHTYFGLYSRTTTPTFDDFRCESP
jgi:hypothetical protein